MNRFSKQSGSVLIISLLLLIVTTLLGLSSMNNTIMEEKMAGNLRQQNLSLQSAESAMRDAEAWLSGLNKNTRPDAVSALTTGIDIWLKDAPEGVSSPSGLWWETDANWNKAETYTHGSSISDVSLTGFYLIEEYQKVSDTITVGQQQDTSAVQDYFQITTYGIGDDGRARSYLRTTYARRF